jgi:hypothetical protein
VAPPRRVQQGLSEGVVVAAQSRFIAGDNMSEAHTGKSACGAIRHKSGNAAALGAADWLCLAAAPTFAIMALLTGVLGGGPPDMLCSAAQDASPLSGMAPMYLLMSAFHSAPWLKLISSRRSGARPSKALTVGQCI